MEQIGQLTTLTNKNFTEFTKVGDFDYFEGPITSLFYDKDNRLYVYHWTDCDDKYNRWLVFNVSKEYLQGYISQKYSLRELLMSSQDIYSVDINNDIEYNNICSVDIKELPESYIPDSSSYCGGTGSPTMKNVESFISNYTTISQI